MPYQFALAGPRNDAMISGRVLDIMLWHVNINIFSKGILKGNIYINFRLMVIFGRLKFFFRCSSDICNLVTVQLKLLKYSKFHGKKANLQITTTIVSGD
jgi:hypothetical protein